MSLITSVEIETARFRTVRVFSQFLGPEYGGTERVAALLDAHPDAIIGYETNALALVENGMNRLEVFKSLLVDQREYVARAKASNTATDYFGDIWQGRFRFIKTIGDRQAALTTAALSAKPELIGRLREMTEASLRYIHIVRNPYDHVAQMSMSTFCPTEECARRYITVMNNVKKIREQLAPEEFIELRLEQLWVRPKELMGRLCSAVKLEPDEAFLALCEKHLVKDEMRPRDLAFWDSVARARLYRYIQETPLLEGYTFDK